MIDIHFEINGKRTNSNNIADALERAMVETIADGLRTQLASVRDPNTGEFPTVVVRGNTLDNLSIKVEGSDAVVALAKARLADEFDAAEQAPPDQTTDQTPNVFLCHGSEDKALVEQGYFHANAQKGALRRAIFQGFVVKSIRSNILRAPIDSAMKAESPATISWFGTIHKRFIDANDCLNTSNLLIFREPYTSALLARIRRNPSGNTTAPFRAFGRK